MPHSLELIHSLEISNKLYCKYTVIDARDRYNAHALYRATYILDAMRLVCISIGRISCIRTVLYCAVRVKQSNAK